MPTRCFATDTTLTNWSKWKIFRAVVKYGTLTSLAYGGYGGLFALVGRYLSNLIYYCSHVPTKIPSRSSGDGPEQEDDCCAWQWLGFHIVPKGD